MYFNVIYALLVSPQSCADTIWYQRDVLMYKCSSEDHQASEHSLLRRQSTWEPIRRSILQPERYGTTGTIFMNGMDHASLPTRKMTASHWRIRNPIHEAVIWTIHHRNNVGQMECVQDTLIQHAQIYYLNRITCTLHVLLAHSFSIICDSVCHLHFAKGMLLDVCHAIPEDWDLVCTYSRNDVLNENLNPLRFAVYWGRGRAEGWSHLHFLTKNGKWDVYSKQGECKSCMQGIPNFQSGKWLLTICMHLADAMQGQSCPALISMLMV